MIDTYLKSTDKEALEELKKFAKNVIEPQQGRAAVEASTDEEGNEIPAQPAAGDAAYWYSCVRFCLPIAAYEGVELCDEGEGEAVVGAWA